MRCIKFLVVVLVLAISLVCHISYAGVVSVHLSNFSSSSYQPGSRGYIYVFKNGSMYAQHSTDDSGNFSLNITSSGNYVFEGYNYNSDLGVREYWGYVSEDIDPESNYYITLNRMMPYASSVNFSPQTLHSVNSSTTCRFVITTPPNYPYQNKEISVRLKLRLKSSQEVVYNETREATGNSVSFDNIILPYPGEYEYAVIVYTKYLDSQPAQPTDSWRWTKGPTVSMNNSTLEFFIHNEGKKNLSGTWSISLIGPDGEIHTYHKKGSTSNGTIELDVENINSGDYKYLIYFISDDGMNIKEYWGKGSVSVNSGQKKEVDFTRNKLYVNYISPTSSEEEGGNVTIKTKICNNTDTAQKVKMEIKIFSDNGAPISDKTTSPLYVPDNTDSYSLPPVTVKDFRPGNYKYEYILYAFIDNRWRIVDHSSFINFSVTNNSKVDYVFSSPGPVEERKVIYVEEGAHNSPMVKFESGVFGAMKIDYSFTNGNINETPGYFIVAGSPPDKFSITQKLTLENLWLDYWGSYCISELMAGVLGLPEGAGLLFEKIFEIKKETLATFYMYPYNSYLVEFLSKTDNSVATPMTYSFHFTPDTVKDIFPGTNDLNNPEKFEKSIKDVPNIRLQNNSFPLLLYGKLESRALSESDPADYIGITPKISGTLVVDIEATMDKFPHGENFEVGLLKLASSTSNRENVYSTEYNGEEENGHGNVFKNTFKAKVEQGKHYLLYLLYKDDGWISQLQSTLIYYTLRMYIVPSDSFDIIPPKPISISTSANKISKKDERIRNFIDNATIIDSEGRVIHGLSISNNAPDSFGIGITKVDFCSTYDGVHKCSSSYVAVKKKVVSNNINVSIKVSSTHGSAPLKENFMCIADNLNKNQIKYYEWDFNGDGRIDAKTDTNSISKVFEVAGAYEVSCAVEAVDGRFRKSRKLLVTVTESEPKPEPKPEPNNTLGDINNDGKINISDVILCLNEILGRTPPSLSADVNNDGAVNITDLILLLRKITEQDEN